MIIIAINETPTGRSCSKVETELSRSFVRLSSDVWIADLPLRVLAQIKSNLRSFASKKTRVVLLVPKSGLYSHECFVIGNDTNNKKLNRISNGQFTEKFRQTKYLDRQFSRLREICKDENGP